MRDRTVRDETLPAAATLGHSSAKLTDEVYAQRDLQRVAEVMKRMG